jgi:hypothetical protein
LNISDPDLAEQYERIVADPGSVRSADLGDLLGGLGYVADRPTEGAWAVVYKRCGDFPVNVPQVRGFLQTGLVLEALRAIEMNGA